MTSILNWEDVEDLANQLSVDVSSASGRMDVIDSDLSHCAPSPSLNLAAAGDAKAARDTLQDVKGKLELLRKAAIVKQMRGFDVTLHDMVDDYGMEEILEGLAAMIRARAQQLPFTAEGVKRAESDLKFALLLEAASEVFEEEELRRMNV